MKRRSATNLKHSNGVGKKEYIAFTITPAGTELYWGWEGWTDKRQKAAKHPDIEKAREFAKSGSGKYQIVIQRF